MTDSLNKLLEVLDVAFFLADAPESRGASVTVAVSNKISREAARAGLAELKKLLAIGEDTVNFYKALPAAKRALAGTILPAELKALLDKAVA